MRKIAFMTSAFILCAVLLLDATAQQPGGAGGKAKKDYSDSTIVTAILAFDKDKTGKVTKSQVTDVRLHRLFDQADANKDGVVTRDELIALASKLEAEVAQDGGKGDKGGKGGPKGKGGPDDKGFKGKGPGGFDDKGPKGKGPGGPPQPGQILPTFVQDQLNLNADQKKQLDQLQKQVDAKLDTILNAEQKQQLRQMRDRRPGGPGGPGGPDGKGPPPMPRD